jgi:hypothetical protein
MNRPQSRLLVPVLLVALPVVLLGATWPLNDVRVSPPGVLAQCAPGRSSIALLPGGRLYAVWYQRTAPQASVVRGAERSAEGVWTIDPTVLSLGDSVVVDPVLAATSSGELHLAWQDLRDGAEEIYYRHRTAGGTWEGEQRLTTGEGESQDVALAVGPNDRLHVVWSDADPGNNEIFHCFRDPEGAFSPPRRLTNHPAESLQPNCVVDSTGTVFLVWEDGLLDGTGPTDFNTEIWFMTLDPDGNPQTGPIRVSRAVGISRNPTIAMGPGGALHIFWSDARDKAPSNPGALPYAIWYRRWLPGLGFGYEKRFAFSAADHLNPMVATSADGAVNVVWEDYINGNGDIYFRQITPATGWDVQPTRLTYTPGPTRYPTLIAEPDGTLDLLWCDASPGEELSVRFRSGSSK